MAGRQDPVIPFYRPVWEFFILAPGTLQQGGGEGERRTGKIARDRCQFLEGLKRHFPQRN